MMYDGKELQIYISDLLPDVQMKVLAMYGVYPDDRNLNAIINCKPLAVIPEAKLPAGLDHPKYDGFTTFQPLREREHDPERPRSFADLRIRE